MTAVMSPPNQDRPSPDRPIHIVLTFDDNFWAPAYAAMRSVCLYTHRRADLVFHLCHRPLLPDHRAALESISDEFGARLMWYDLDRSELFKDIAERMPYNKRLTNIVYARLVIDRLLDSSVTKVLYLDCDIFVKAPIEGLYDIDMQGHPIAAVPDAFAARITLGRDLMNNRDLFHPANPYFNAGVILIDVAQWRAADILVQLETAMANGVMQRIYYDQDLLNLIFADRWLMLPVTWNMIDARHAHEGLNYNLMHYTAARKPWHLVSGVAYARLYRHVMTNAIYYRYMRERWARYWRRLPMRLIGRA